MIRCFRTVRSARSRPGLGQDRLLALAALDEPFRLEPLQHLAGRRARDAEHLGDPRRERRQRRALRVVLADREREEVDRLQVLVDRRCPAASPDRSRAIVRCGTRVGCVLPRRPGLRRAARRLSLAVPGDRARDPLRAARLPAVGVADDPLARPTRASGSATGASSAPTSPASGSTRSRPARAGDVVKLYLIRHRITDSTLHDARADADRRDALRRARRRRVHHLGARQRRAADPPGLLAAAVGRLGLLRQARASGRSSASLVLARRRP